MKILFTYNARLFVNKNGDFFGNEFNPLVIKRYKLGNACVKLILRQKKITAIEEVNLEKFCLEHSWMVEFIPDFGSVLSFIQNFRKLDRSCTSLYQSSNFLLKTTASPFESANKDLKCFLVSSEMDSVLLSRVFCILCDSLS